MAKLEWDQIQGRIFEAGIDRGVLYPLGGVGVVWNGLVSVTEKTARDVKSFYSDGIKFLDSALPGAYSGQIQALTYPNEMDALIGLEEFAPGVRVHDQRGGMFHLSYRTLVGDALDGLDLGYKLHLVYNLTANPNDASFNSLAEKEEASAFQWDITGAQSPMFGIRPSNHISFDSRFVDPEILEDIENTLYGTTTLSPAMPDLVQLLQDIEEATT